MEEATKTAYPMISEGHTLKGKTYVAKLWVMRAMVSDWLNWVKETQGNLQASGSGYLTTFDPHS